MPKKLKTGFKLAPVKVALWVWWGARGYVHLSFDKYGVWKNGRNVLTWVQVMFAVCVGVGVALLVNHLPDLIFEQGFRWIE